MAMTRLRKPEVFLDTSYAVALVAPTDRHHLQAKDLAQDLERLRIRLVTTRAVLLEIGNSFSRSRYKTAVINLLTVLEVDPRVEILPFSEELFHRGFELFRQRPDKAWSLVDCVFFAVMRERKLQDCLTTDGHFAQAGFRALLRN